MDTLHLFAGGGGGILADLLLGHSPRVAVEIDPYCREVLKRRLPNLEIFSDIKAFNGVRYRGRIDIVAGGFPCQDISVAGKGAGLKGARSSLWTEMLRVVGEVRPRYVFIENAPVLRTRGLETVLRDLHVLGYDAAWTVLSAEDVGAPHLRKRMWIVAIDAHCEPLRVNEQRPTSGRHNLQTSGQAEPGQHGSYGDTEEVANPESISERAGLQSDEPTSVGRGRSGDGRSPGSLQDSYANSWGCEGLREPMQPGQQSASGNQPHQLRSWGPCEIRLPNSTRLEDGQGQPGDPRSQLAAAIGADWWASEPALGRVVDGIPRGVAGPTGLTLAAYRAAQVKALGNAQCPLQAATAFTYLKQQLELNQ